MKIKTGIKAGPSDSPIIRGWRATDLKAHWTYGGRHVSACSTPNVGMVRNMRRAVSDSGAKVHWLNVSRV